MDHPKADIRWQQRLGSFRQAVSRLAEAVRLLDEAEAAANFDASASHYKLFVEGTIQRFEFTYELAWKTLADYLKAEGHQELKGPSSVLAKALEVGLLADRNGWKDMHQARNLTTHTYDETKAAQIADDIQTRFLSLFISLRDKLYEISQAEGFDLIPPPNR